MLEECCETDRCKTKRNWSVHPVKGGESFTSARSTMGLLRRVGWRCGTRVSGVIAVSIVACRAAFPLMATLPTGDATSYHPTLMSLRFSTTCYANAQDFH